jgi:hypothetical protein
MPIGRRFLLALLYGALVLGCGLMPVPVLNGEVIVMEVANHGAQPATLVVASSGDERKIVGSAEPSIVPAGQTVTVRFVVPPAGHWAIWANGGELMGDRDIGQRRGKLPMGIDIGGDGSPGWWCQANCP